MKHLFILFLSCLTLATLASCGTAVDTSSSTTSSKNRDTQLPFPVDRIISDVSTRQLDGIHTTERSPDAFEQGTSLLLSSDPNTAQFATYSFYCGADPLFISISFENPTNTSAYLAIANYGLMRWKFFGPVTGDSILEVDQDNNLSPFSNLHVAVVVANGGQACVKQVELTMDGTLPEAAFDITPESGDAPLLVSFDATASLPGATELVKYEWDWNGDGFYDHETDNPISEYTFMDPGPYNVTLKITNELGNSDITTRSLSIHGWVKIFIDYGNISSDSLNLIDDVPAIAYGNFLDGGGVIKYARSKTEHGLNSSDWSDYVVDALHGGPTASLSCLDGHPVIAYTGAPSWWDSRALYFATPETEILGDLEWKSVPVDDTVYAADPSLEIINNHPAIAYRSHPEGSLLYAVSATQGGEDAQDWYKLKLLDDNISTGNIYLSEFNNKPAISYNTYGSSSAFAVSSSQWGSIKSDWSFVSLDANGLFVGAPGTATFPMFFSSHPDSAPDSADFLLSYYFAATDGSSASDWQNVTIDSHDTWIQGMSSSTINNIPVASYIYGNDGSGLNSAVIFAEALVPQPLLPSDWNISTVTSQVQGDVTHIFYQSSVTCINGLPAVCYSNSATEIWYAIRY